jgi:excisionase family DNA binding protein
MPRWVTTSQAAQMLGTSKPTVTTLIAKGILQASRQTRGKLSIWHIDESSVQRWLGEHGRYDEHNHERRSRLARLEVEVLELRNEVRTRLSANRAAPDPSPIEAAARERDDLRARMVSLEDALGRAHLVAELQRDADRERAAVIEHLLEAAAASERADGLRRQAITELEEAVAAFSRPGHAAEIS